VFGNKFDLDPKVLGSARMGQTQAMMKGSRERPEEWEQRGEDEP
jgi:hypothetical protein